MAELTCDPRFLVKAAFSALNDAYAPVEAEAPDIILCTRDVAALPEFAMFGALADLLGSQVICVAPAGDLSGVLRALGLPTVPRPSVSSQAPTALTVGPQRVVAIGSSTGGIEALSCILEAYPKDCPPTVVVQHIKGEFLDSVVARLDAVCRAQVRTATPDFKLATGQVVFAPGLPVHLEIEPVSLRCRLRDGPPVSGHRPSVDRLFHSVAALKSRAVGVLLTGMGRDGATGLGEMRRAGAWTIAQDAATSIVYGMPRVAHEEGAVCEVVTLPRMCRAILSAARISSEVAS